MALPFAGWSTWPARCIHGTNSGAGWHGRSLWRHDGVTLWYVLPSNHSAEWSGSTTPAANGGSNHVRPPLRRKLPVQRSRADRRRVSCQRGHGRADESNRTSLGYSLIITRTIVHHVQRCTRNGMGAWLQGSWPARSARRRRELRPARPIARNPSAALLDGTQPRGLIMNPCLSRPPDAHMPPSGAAPDSRRRGPWPLFRPIGALERPGEALGIGGPAETTPRPRKPYSGAVSRI